MAEELCNTDFLNSWFFFLAFQLSELLPVSLEIMLLFSCVLTHYLHFIAISHLTTLELSATAVYLYLAT